MEMQKRIAPKILKIKNLHYLISRFGLNYYNQILLLM